MVRCSREPQHRLWVTSRVGQTYLRQNVVPTLSLGSLPTQEGQEFYLLKDESAGTQFGLWWPAEDSEEAKALWGVLKACLKGAARAAPPSSAAGVPNAGQALLASLKREGGGASSGGGSAGGTNGGGSGGHSQKFLAPSVAALFSSAGSSGAGSVGTAAPKLLIPSGSGSNGTAAALGAAAAAPSGASSGGGGGGGGFELSKEALRESLIQLISTDDRVLDLLHLTYVKCLKAKREREKGAGPS